MNFLGKIVEWIFPALREMRIEFEMDADGEDAVSAEDSEWIARRNRRRGIGHDRQPATAKA